MTDGVVKATLLPRDDAELQVRVGQGRIDLHGAFEARDGFRKLATPLMNQAQLIMGVGIVRIGGRDSSCCWKCWRDRMPSPRERMLEPNTATNKTARTATPGDTALPESR